MFILLLINFFTKEKKFDYVQYYFQKLQRHNVSNNSSQNTLNIICNCCSSNEQSIYISEYDLTIYNNEKICYLIDNCIKQMEDIKDIINNQFQNQFLVTRLI